MKSYGQYCGVAKALDILGERWTLLVVRDMLLGPRRFSDFKRSLHGIAPNLLSKRLRMLVEVGLVTRQGEQYSLTEQGRSLEGVVLGLGAFGAQFMNQRGKHESVDVRHAMLSLKRRYRPSKQAGRLSIRCGDASFSARIGGAALELCDGAPAAADVHLAGDFSGWFPLLSRRRSLRELEGAGLIERQGPARLAQAFVRAVGALP